MSVLQTWFTRSTLTSRSKYGYTLWLRSPADSLGLGWIASSPIRRISLCTLLRLTCFPLSIFSQATTRREP